MLAVAAELHGGGGSAIILCSLTTTSSTAVFFGTCLLAAAAQGYGSVLALLVCVSLGVTLWALRQRIVRARGCGRVKWIAARQ